MASNVHITNRESRGTLSLSLSQSLSHCLTAPICPSSPLSTRQHHCPPVNTTVHPSTPLFTRQHHCSPVNTTVHPSTQLSHRRPTHARGAFTGPARSSVGARTVALEPRVLSLHGPSTRQAHCHSPSPEPVGAPRVCPPAGRTRECCRVVAGLALTRASGQPGQTPIKSTSVSLSAYLSLVAVNSSQIKASGGGGRAGDPGRARG